MSNYNRLVISGGTSGLGKAIVDYYKTIFNDVIILTRNPINNHENVRYIEADFKYPEEIVEVLCDKGIYQTDVLINNAGWMPLDDFTQMGLETEVEILDVNFTSHYVTMKHFMKSANPIQPLSIINVASVCGINPDSETPMYACAKSAVIAMTKAFATYKPKSIRVNCISPGFFNTNLVPGSAPPEMLDVMVPQKREADPKEIIPVVKMILESPFMTGANIVIDGGQSCK